MKSFGFSFAMKCAIIAISFCGLAICALWFPFSISLTSSFSLYGAPTLSQQIELWSQLIFYWLSAIPCFVILFFVWKIANNIKNGEVFTVKTANLIRLCGIILSIDLCAFLIGNIVFLLLSWNDFAIIYFMLSTVGICLAVFSMILSHYTLKAASLQEEVEGLI